MNGKNENIGGIIMIVDDLKHTQLYAKMGANLEEAFHYIATTDLTNLPEGKFAIDGEKLFAVVSQYETKALEQCSWEAHRKYIDIQIILSGKEKMGYCRINDMRTTTAYDQEKDLLFLEGQGDFVTVKEGMFALFAPNDAHMPGVQVDNPESVKKIVVKVLTEQ